MIKSLRAIGLRIAVLSGALTLASAAALAGSPTGLSNGGTSSYGTDGYACDVMASGCDCGGGKTVAFNGPVRCGGGLARNGAPLSDCYERATANCKQQGASFCEKYCSGTVNASGQKWMLCCIKGVGSPQLLSETLRYPDAGASETLIIQCGKSGGRLYDTGVTKDSTCAKPVPTATPMATPPPTSGIKPMSSTGTTTTPTATGVIEPLIGTTPKP